MSPQWELNGSTWYLYRLDPYLSRASKVIFQYVRWSESAEEYVDMRGAPLGKDLDVAKTKIEKEQFSAGTPALDWAIRSIVDGKESDRIIECKTEVEARDWVERFPQSYCLLSRESAGEWRSFRINAEHAAKLDTELEPLCPDSPDGNHHAAPIGSEEDSNFACVACWYCGEKATRLGESNVD